MKTILSTDPADWKASPHGSKTIDQMVAMKKTSALFLLTLTLIGASASWSAASTLPQASAPRPFVLTVSGEVTPGSNPTEMIVIDAGISDAAKLAEEVRPGIRVMMLDPKTDELAQLASALQNQHGLSAIHVVSHGAPGMLQLGTQTLGSIDLAAHRQEWSAIGRSLRPGGEILLYGCSIAKGSEGQNMVHALAALTGVNVAASTDQTGAADLGGNWKLEYCTSGQPMVSPFVAGFQYHNILPANRLLINPGNNPISVRPGGTSYVWTVGSSSGATSTLYPVTTIAYYNVPAFGWYLTRGSYQYSVNNGATWTTYSVSANPTYMTVAGTMWRFVDTAPNDKTNVNNLGVSWTLQGFPGITTSTGTSITPDNPPTDITLDHANISILNDATPGKTVATATPVDTGSTLYGYWAIDSQSVPNLLVLTNDSTAGNTAALNLGTGLASMSGTNATVTLHYYDMYQTDTNGDPIPGQGISKTFNIKVVPEATTNLNFTPDLLVNTYTTNDQSYQAMATLTDGSFVVVWQSEDEGDKTNGNYGIYGQHFTSTGARIGGEFLISDTGSAVDEQYPAITALPGGRYAVAYVTTPPTTNSSIGVRIIETDGTVGSQIIANKTFTNNQIAVCMTTLTNGSFVVAWASDIGDVKLQQFATNGATIGSPVTIVVQSGYYPGITALTNGSYAIAWLDYNTGDAFEQIGASGSVVDTGIYSSNYGPPHLAGLTNGFVVISDVWDNPTSTSQVEGARYNNNNVLQGSLFRVNAETDGNRFYSTVATTSDGGFVVLWESDTDDFDADGIFGRRFTSTGTPVDASDFEVNQHRSNDEIIPSVTALPNDLFAGAWTTIPDGSYISIGDIYARVLLPANVAPTFVGSTTTLLVGENVATNITGLLHVSDSDSGQTETWSQYSAPSHGALAFSGATASSGSANITPGGTITYTPYANYSGSDSFTVQVSDGDGGTATRAITVTVNPPTGITSGTTTSGIYGSAFTFTITASNSPTGFGASGLPTGLGINTGSGVISGTPTQSGNFSVTISATNATSVGTATLTLTIQKVNLTVSGITANNKVYDSTTFATLNAGAATLNGVVNGDSIMLNTSGISGTFVSKDVGNGITVTISGLTISGTAVANYTLTQPTTNANIGPAPLIVSGIIVSNKIYDGTNTATFNLAAAALNGVFSGDTVTLNTNSATAMFADANVGTNKTVAISGLTIEGPQVSDYALTQPTATANILPVNLTVSGIIASNKIYDGNNVATLNWAGATLNGVVNNDSITLNTAGVIATFANANVGTEKPVIISGLGLSGAAAANYTLTQPTMTADILPTHAEVTLHRSVQLYDGSAKSVTATTLPLGLPVALTYNGSSAPSAVGAYTVIGTIANPNYSGGATNYLYVVTVPQFSNVQYSNSSIVFTWTTMPQVNYQVVYTPSLCPITWTNFNSPVSATDTNTSSTDAIPAGSITRFYRVKVILE